MGQLMTETPKGESHPCLPASIRALGTWHRCWDEQQIGGVGWGRAAVSSGLCTLPSHRDPCVSLVASSGKIASWPRMAAGAPEITSSCRPEEKGEKSRRTLLGLSFPYLYNGRMGLALKLCSLRSQELSPSSGQDVTERVMGHI